MKNLKTLICIAICLLASFSVLLLSPFTLNSYADFSAYSKGYINKSQTSYLSIEDKDTNLYYENSSSSTGALYTLKIIGGGVKGDISATYENGVIKATSTETGLGAFGIHKDPRLETAFRLASKYNRAVENGLLNVTLSAEVSNNNANNTYLGLQSGTLNDSGSTISWTEGGDIAMSYIGSTSTLTSASVTFTPIKVGDYTDIMVLFENDWAGTWLKEQILTVSKPKITLGSNRQGGPEISTLLINGTEFDSGWAKSKEITFTVEDNQIGIDYVTINGNRIDCDEATMNSETLKSYTFFVDSVAETNYTIVAYDYLGGSTTVSKKIGLVDNCDVSDVIIDAEESYHEKDISISISFVEDTTHSNDSVYYTLIDNSTGEDPTPIPNDTTGKTREVPHQNGRYTFNFPFEYDGEYTLTILIIDEAGHQKVFSHSFTIDSVKRRVNVISHNGSFTLSGVFTDEDGYYTWNGENITLNYKADENFSFYKLLRNGSEIQSNGSVYNYICRDADINIEIFNRFIISVTADNSYEFNEDGVEIDYTLNSTYLLNALTKEELANLLDKNIEELTQEQILEELNSLISSNLTFIIKYNGFKVDTIYNKGIYNVTYNIDTSNFVGSNSFDITVLQKALQVEFLENNFIYNGDIQHVNYKELQGLVITPKYYLLNEFGEESREETIFKNAGTYKIVLTLNDDNYYLTNGEEFITINKKQVTAEIKNTTFKYNGNNQNITYILDYEIASNVKYFITDEEGSLIETIFKNAGNYTYLILPTDEINYEIINNINSCEILKVIANITVNKTVYDYNGDVLNLDYSITDENNELVEVNNLVVTFTVNNKEMIFSSPNCYDFSFDTIDRDNYILAGTLQGSVIVKKTIINIFVETTIYEYTGSEIILNYYFVNENNDKLNSLKNISLQFVKNGEEVDFQDCGEYSYEFVTTDVNYELIYNNKTNVTIIPAELNIQILENVYIYNQLGNSLNYLITSRTGIDFTNNNYITLNITNNGEESFLLNVGTYQYNFISTNQNIILSSGNILGEIIIQPKQVTVESVTSTLTYTGEEQEFSYTLSENISSSCEIDTLLNAGRYEYVIFSEDENYAITNGTGIVIVNPKNIKVLDINSTEIVAGEEVKISNIYNGENLNITFTLQDEIEAIVTYKIVGDSEIFNDIKDANSYNIFITPINTNYVVDTSNIIILINPKPVEIIVTNTNQIYSKENKFINVVVKDNVDYSVTYFDENGDEIRNIQNAGLYSYVVSLNNPNYTGSVTGTFSIEKLNVTLVVDADQYKVYGDNAEENYTYSIQGIINGDSIKVTLSREQGENVGFYAINLVDYSNSNYNVNYVPVSYKIIARKLIVIANSITKIFDDEDELLTYQISYGELVFNDTLFGTLERESGEDVGVYNINIGSLQTLNPNYQIIFRKANFTILPKDLEIKLNNVETTYGINVTLSYSVVGNYNESMLSGEITRESGNNVGEYEITKGTLQSNNYNLIITNGVYRINPKTATITPINIQKTYGEEDNLYYTVTGLINNDTLKGSLSREEGNDAGDYLINLGTLETLNPNYKFSLPETYFTIIKAVITVDIDNQTQVYGEQEKELTYTISGLKLNDEINLKPFRESGFDVGEYQIACGIPQLNNYIVLLNSGLYTITKAKISPVLVATTSTYNGKVQHFTNTTFPFPLEYTYKRNGIEVDSVIDAGLYIVQAYFAGNNNYEEARSNAVAFTINKISVCFNLGDNNFIYDGEVKTPEFTFDSSIGLSMGAITFEFDNDVQPKEIGSYPFNILVNDSNYEGRASGVLTISKLVTIVSDIAIIECEDAIYDANIANLKLVNSTFNGNFNNQQVLQACSFENISGIENSHIFTVRMKAKTNDSNVYVYKIDKDNNASEVVVSVQDGYYVFKIDGLDCQYIITKDIEPMSLITVAVIIGVSIIVLIAIIIAFKVKRNRKKKLALKLANSNKNVIIEENSVVENLNNLNKKNKKVRVDDVISGALNNGTINTEIESVLDTKSLTKTENTTKENNNQNDLNK